MEYEYALSRNVRGRGQAGSREVMGGPRSRGVAAVYFGNFY